MLCEKCVHNNVCVTKCMLREDERKDMIACKSFLRKTAVAPMADVIGEYRKRVYAKMEKYAVFGREYMQRIMREVEKEMTEGKK